MQWSIDEYMKQGEQHDAEANKRLLAIINEREAKFDKRVKDIEAHHMGKFGMLSKMSKLSKEEYLDADAKLAA